MYKDKLDGAISAADYSLFRNSLTAEEHETADRIKAAQKQIADCRERMKNAESQKALIEQYSHFDRLDRSVADEFIDYVEIGLPDDDGQREIHIHWKL